MKELWRITLDTNPDDCNLHCIMCEQHSRFAPKKSGKPGRMPIAMLTAILKEAQELGVKEIIPSTMGEPLLYKEFETILTLCRKLGLRINLTTNGTFPKYGAIAWAEKVLPLCSDVKISVNGVSKEVQESVMQGSELKTAWSNITDFLKVRDQLVAKGETKSTVTLQVTFLQSNVSELPALLERAIELGVDRLKGHHLWIHFDEISDLSMRRSRESILEWNQVAEQLIAIAESKKLANGKEIKLANIYSLNPDEPEKLLEGGTCPFLGKELWINHEGKFSPCCAPDELRTSLGDFGSYSETSIKTMWNSAAYNELMKNYQIKPLCQTCNMKV